LSLAGDKYAMAEAEIDDPITANDWERGDVNSLFIESADLGDIVRGTLRHDGSGAFSDWAVESVKVRNDEDGRTWIASVSTTITRNQPYHLVFLSSGSGDGLMSLGGIVGPPKARASRLEPGEEDFRARSVARSQQRSSPKPSMTPLLRTTNVSLSEPLQSVMTEPTQTAVRAATRSADSRQCGRRRLAPRLQRTPTRNSSADSDSSATLVVEHLSKYQVSQGRPRQDTAKIRALGILCPRTSWTLSEHRATRRPDPGENRIPCLKASWRHSEQGMILAMTGGSERAGSVGNPMPENELDALRAQGYTDRPDPSDDIARRRTNAG
jgi:hypothetical protein